MQRAGDTQRLEVADARAGDVRINGILTIDLLDAYEAARSAGGR
jgi:hypothetical protein